LISVCKVDIFGAGIGASHQTGWTGTIARTMQMFAQMSGDDALKFSKAKALKITREPVQTEEKTKKERVKQTTNTKKKQV
jgi:hypothetical protein